MVKNRNVTLSRRSLSWMTLTKITYLLKQENKAWLSCSTLRQILNYQITLNYKTFWNTNFCSHKRKVFPMPHFPPKNMEKDPPDNIFYSVHISLLNIFSKPSELESWVQKMHAFNKCQLSPVLFRTL